MDRLSTCTFLQSTNINVYIDPLTTSRDISISSSSNVCGQTVTTKCSGMAPNGVCQVTTKSVYGDGDASKATWADYRTSPRSTSATSFPTRTRARMTHIGRDIYLWPNDLFHSLLFHSRRYSRREHHVSEWQRRYLPWRQRSQERTQHQVRQHPR